MPRLLRPCASPGCANTTSTGPHCSRCAHRTGRAHRITLVCGPPCAGKNTYVREHMRHGDLIVDLDAIYTALGATGDHDQPDALRPFVFDARDAITNRLIHGDHNIRAAWIIHSAPRPATRAEWKQRGARVVMITATEDTCTRRAHAHRPAAWSSHIQDWFATYRPGHVDHTITTG